MFGDFFRKKLFITHFGVSANTEIMADESYATRLIRE